MRKHFFKQFILAVAVLLHFSSYAEDIDLFVGAPPSTTDVPNVLIVLDNTANWNTAFTNEMNALKSVINALPVNKFRVGLMMYTETGSGNGNPGGAYVRAAIRLMDATNKAKYANLVASLDIGDDKGNGRSLGLAMVESYLYFSGQDAYSGGNKKKRDYFGNVLTPDSTYSNSNSVYALSGNAFSSASSTTYLKPSTSDCAKNYVIYIGNTTATGNVTKDSSSENSTATTKLASNGGAIIEIPISPSGHSDNIANEWARFMKISPEAITTYTVDVSQGTGGNALDNSALLESMANVSDGKYFLVNSTADSGKQIVDALNSIFSEIQSVNSVFASVSLPVSVNTQGTYLNQVYIGMFRPDSDAKPRWAGNLKQYKLGRAGNVSTGTLQLQDANSAAAINNTTGFITECARSFWTPTSTDTEWAGKPQGDCLTVANSQASNYPDGNIVEKGAQAYKLRGSSTRTVYTCSATDCATRLIFNNTNVSATDLGAASTSERDALINWTIGTDVDDENLNLNSTTERRLSAHADVVHSRPTAVNFGTISSPNVVVFYGTNDGLLHAINGNRTSPNIGSIPPGGELWSFMTPDFYPTIKRLRDNTTAINFPNTTITSPTPLPKPYGFDGPITAFKGKLTSAGTEKTFVYATMRRGGRGLYAFDVTNTVTDPTNPTFKWMVGCNKAGTCTSGMSGIGQTWSSVKSLTASGYGSGVTPMIIMGGGYDTCEDADTGTANNSCTSTSKGHYVYVLNADTGAVIKTFDTAGTRGIVGDITIVRDSAGQAIYGYAVDLGGNVYRIKFGDSTANADNSGTWTMTKIASLGCSTTTACNPNRKFMFAPSVADVDGNYAIMLGSGDREKPLTYYTATTGVSNYFFMFTDKPTVASATYPGSADCGSEIICLNSLLHISGNTSPTAAALAAKRGWYLSLTATEQVVTSAVTIFGIVNFSTHQPAVPVEGMCSNLGTARVYNVAYNNAASATGTADRFGTLPPLIGLAPTPVAGMVTLDGESTPVPFCIGCDASSPLEGGDPGGLVTGSQPKSRVYWYRQK